MQIDRMGVLLHQFDTTIGMAKARLEGLGDDEFRWEPAPGAWSIRRRGEGRSPRPFGPGEWLIDDATVDPDPAPVTTIAWRLEHLRWTFAGRWEWTFGERKQPTYEVVDFTPDAAEAQKRFWELMDRWRAAIAAMTDEQLDMPGFGQFPNGSDPEWPFITIIGWTNLELIHHMAEIGLLRDLYRRAGA